MSDYKYAYEKLMAENKLQLKDLPKDAQIGIQSIKEVEKAVRMRTKTGKPVTEAMVDKLKYHDNAVVSAILEKLDIDTNADDFVEDFDKKDGYEKLEELTEGEGKDDSGKDGDDTDGKSPVPETTPAPAEPTKEALEIEAEIKKLFDSGKKEATLDELKVLAPKSWNVLFNNYTKDGDNGIETSNYSLFEENAEYVFTINKL